MLGARKLQALQLLPSVSAHLHAPSSTFCQACSLCLSQPTNGSCELEVVVSTTNSFNRGQLPLISDLMAVPSTTLKLTVKLSRSGQCARASCEVASGSKLLRLICTASLAGQSSEVCGWTNKGKVMHHGCGHLRGNRVCAAAGQPASSKQE